MTATRAVRHLLAMLLAATTWGAAAAPPIAHANAVARTAWFPSADGKTTLVGYLFEPEGAGPHPAIVLLHGRAGPYSANVNADCTFVAQGQASPCNAATLSKRHEMWGEYWAAHGYMALLVDSFGPRGRGHGYGPAARTTTPTATPSTSAPCGRSMPKARSRGSPRVPTCAQTA